MSQTIDSRIVEMKFDNKNFEKNVAESMKTLENLDKRLTKLENTDVHLDKIGKAADGFDLSKLDKSLDAITHRFSVMGQVGASVINNITTDAYNMVKAFNSKVFGAVFGQIKSGGKSRALNIAEAQFRIEGLGLNYDDYYKSIDDAVTGTAYGFDEAAVAASQFASSGVQAGKDMDDALRSISGMAAMTGRSYTDLASVMEDAAAAGKVSNDTFSRLAERGLAALQEYAKRTNQTVDDVRAAAKKGEISFVEFARVMNEAYGEHATKADDTFTGVTSNIRAQLSRIGQSFYSPLITNNSDLIEMLKSVKKQIKAIKEYTDPLAESMSNYVLKLARYGKGVIDNLDVSKLEPVFQNAVKVFDNLTKSAENLYSNILKPLGKQVKAALYEVFPSLNTGKGLLVTISDKILDLSQRFREFTADIGLFGEKGLAVKDIFVALFNAIKVGSQIIKSAMTLIGAGLKVIGSAITNFNLAGLLNNFTSFIALVAQIGYWIIAGIGQGLISGTPILFSSIVEVGKMIIDAFCSFFGIASPSKKMADSVGYWLTAGIAEGLKKALFAGLITAAILLVGSLIIKTLSSVGQDVQSVFDGIVNNIAKTFTRFSKWLSETAFGKAFKSGFELIATVLEKLSNAVKSFDSTKLSQVLDILKRFVLLGTYTYVMIQFAAASTYFTSALRNISRAAKIYMSSLYIKYFGATLKNLAIAIGVITGSILLFAGMIRSGSGKELLQGLAVVTAIVVGLVAATTKLKGAFKAAEIGPNGIIRVEALFLGLATSIFLIASAIKKVGKLELPQLIAGVVSIGMFLFAITGLMLAVEAVSSQMPKESAVDTNLWVPLLGIAVSVRIIAGAISKVAKIPVENVWRAGIIIGALTAVIGGITVLSQLVTTIDTGEHSSILGLAAMLLALGIAVKLITNAIVQISNFPENALDQGIEVVRKIMGWLSALLFFSVFAQKVLGTILIGFAATVAAIAGAIWLIGQMESGIAQGIATVVGILSMIAVFIGAVNIINRVTNGGGDNGGTRALLYVAACIAAMGAVVYATGQLEWGQIAKGLAVVAVLTGFATAVGLLLGMLNGEVMGPNPKGAAALKRGTANIGKTLRTILIIRTVVNQLIKVAMVAVVLAKMDFTENEITRSVLMMTGIIGVLSLLLLAAGALSEKFPNMQKITKPLIAITGAILVIAGALILLGTMDAPATVITSMFAIGGILLAMGQVLEKSKVFGVQGMNVKGILAASAAIIAISAALSLLVVVLGDDIKNKWPVLLAAVIALSVVLAAIAGCMKFVDKVQIDMKSVGAFLLSTLSLVAITAAIAVLAYYVDDIKKAGIAAGSLGIVFFAMGVTLKIAESVHWSVAGGLFIASLSLVMIAATIAGLANYVDDLNAANEAAKLLGIVLLEMGLALATLAIVAQYVGSGSGEAGAGIILAIAAAFGVMGLSMTAAATGIYIGVAAIEKLISVLTPENAQQVVGFFETIGDGIGTVGQHIASGIKTAADAIHDAVAAIKQETDSMGYDVAHGLATGLTKYAPLVAIAGAFLGAMAIDGLRSDEGLDSHSDSVKSVAAGYDVDHGLGTGLTENADLAVNPAKQLGFSVIDGLFESLSTGLNSTGFKDIAVSVAKKVGQNFSFQDLLNGSFLRGNFGTLVSGTFSAYAENAVEGVQNGVNKATTNAASSGTGNGLMDIITGMFGGLTSGNFDNVLGGFDWTQLLGGDGVSGLKDYLAEAGVSMDNLSGDNIPKLIAKLKEGGLAGDELIAALKELGITEDQLKDLGLADKLGIEEAKDGIKDTEEALKSLADEIISGKFGNAPERWDKMFEHLVKSGKTAEEAYAAIADAQNEVNKRLGSSVVHTADEMSKKVSESVKKANKAQADANAKAKGETGKPGRDFKTDPFKSDSKVSKEDSASAAEQQMLNNMPYENVKLAKEKQITAEREKQTAEAFKQKLANEHMYTLAEKQEALKGLKANEEIARQASLTTEKKKQLDAENARYQKVVDTYDEQQKMLKSIQDQESATKKAEEAEKKRGDAVKASSGAVVYGTEEYYKQTGKAGMTINTMPTRKVEETKPVQAETKVEVTPKFEVKKADTTQIKKEVVTTVETELKELQAKATITPKIDTAQAEAAISNFKQKTQDLKGTIPETFSGISKEVSQHIGTIASKILQEGTKIASNTKTVFQNAVSAAITILNGNDTITKFTNAGKSATQGYANGIRNNLSLVRSAGTALGNTAIKAAKAATKTNSPSKIFTQLGKWNGIGYGNGMIDSIGYVTNASSKMADASLDEVYRIVNAVEDAVNNGLDVDPTITPVIDTTQIQNGISSMRSVMDMSSIDAQAITANMSAKASYDDSQVEEMGARMDAMRTAFNDLATVVSNQPTPEVNANVVLQGDANGVFKLVRNQDSIYTKMHGKSAFA